MRRSWVRFPLWAPRKSLVRGTSACAWASAPNGLIQDPSKIFGLGSPRCVARCANAGPESGSSSSSCRGTRRAPEPANSVAPCTAPSARRSARWPPGQRGVGRPLRVDGHARWRAARPLARARRATSCRRRPSVSTAGCATKLLHPDLGKRAAAPGHDPTNRRLLRPPRSRARAVPRLGPARPRRPPRRARPGGSLGLDAGRTRRRPRRHPSFAAGRSSRRRSPTPARSWRLRRSRTPTSARCSCGARGNRRAARRGVRPAVDRRRPRPPSTVTIRRSVASVAGGTVVKETKTHAARRIAVDPETLDALCSGAGTRAEAAGAACRCALRP